MQKMRDWIGLPVLEMEDGTQIGVVEEVVLNMEEARIFGVAVTSPTWFSDERGIFFHDVLAVGRDAVTVRTPEVVRKIAWLEVCPGAIRLRELCDKPVYAETGDYLGAMTDLVCDAVTGEVRYYELSDGLVADVLNGRLLMPPPRAQIVAEDRLVVPATSAKLLHSQDQEPGGVS